MRSQVSAFCLTLSSCAHFSTTKSIFDIQFPSVLKKLLLLFLLGTLMFGFHILCKSESASQFLRVKVWLLLFKKLNSDLHVTVWPILILICMCVCNVMFFFFFIQNDERHMVLNYTTLTFADANICTYDSAVLMLRQVLISF